MRYRLNTTGRATKQRLLICRLRRSTFISNMFVSLWTRNLPASSRGQRITRSQAVAKTANRTASQHRLSSKQRLLFLRYWALSILGHEFDLSGSRDVIGDVTIRFPIGYFLSVILWKQASILNVFRDTQWQIWRNGWHDLDTTSKQRSTRSFILVPIDSSYTTSYRLSIVTFALGRTVLDQRTVLD